MDGRVFENTPEKNLAPSPDSIIILDTPTPVKEKRLKRLKNREEARKQLKGKELFAQYNFDDGDFLDSESSSSSARLELIQVEGSDGLMVKAVCCKSEERTKNLIESLQPDDELEKSKFGAPLVYIDESLGIRKPTNPKPNTKPANPIEIIQISSDEDESTSPQQLSKFDESFDKVDSDDDIIEILSFTAPNELSTNVTEKNPIDFENIISENRPEPVDRDDTETCSFDVEAAEKCDSQPDLNVSYDDVEALLSEAPRKTKKVKKAKMVLDANDIPLISTFQAEIPKKPKPPPTASQLNRAAERERKNEEKLQRQKLNQEKKQKREALKLAQTRTKLTEKLRHKAFSSLQEWKTTGRAEHTIPIISKHIISKYLEDEHLEAIPTYAASYEANSLPHPISVKWKQRKLCFNLAEDEESGPSIAQKETIVELQNYLIEIPLHDFVEMVWNQNVSESSATGQLVHHVQQLTSRFAANNLTFFIHGLDDYYRNLAKNRATYPIVPAFTDKALVKLQCTTHTTIHMVESSTQLIELIGRITKALEKRPFFHAKQNALKSVLGHSTSARLVVKSIKVNTQSGEGLKSLWHSQLCQIPTVNKVHADIIVARYKCLSNLLNAYKECGDRVQCEQLFENIPIPNGKERMRKFGVASKHVYRFYVVHNENELIKE